MSRTTSAFRVARPTDRPVHGHRFIFITGCDHDRRGRKTCKRRGGTCWREAPGGKPDPGESPETPCHATTGQSVKAPSFRSSVGGGLPQNRRTASSKRLGRYGLGRKVMLWFEGRSRSMYSGV